MRFKKCFYILGTTVLIVSGFYFVLQENITRNGAGPSLVVETKSGSRENAEVSEKLLENLSLEQKIGQLFLIGFNGEEWGTELQETINSIKPGGILLLGRNIKDGIQLKNLVAELQSFSLSLTNLPLFIAVDQEGEPLLRIAFLKEKTSNASLNDIKEAYEVGLARGRELKELGVNLNLAPVLDSADEEDFIFSRTFQKDSEKSGRLGRALVEGQKSANILSVLKHFPGYQGISFDPENEKLPFVSNIPSLIQFQIAMEAQPEMVMLSNVVYRTIDEKLPLALSHSGIEFVKNNLRGNYLLISDDLSSDVLKDNFSLERTIIDAFQNGIDILLVAGFHDTKDPLIAFKALLHAVQNNEISEQRINQSVSKIIKLKKEKLEP